MAPELRKRKSLTETKISDGSSTKVVEKVTKVNAKTKRKAADDSSPVTLKKQKSTTIVETKPTAVETKPKAKTTKKSKPTPAVTKAEVTVEDTILPINWDTSDSEGEGGQEVQELALQVDPEDDVVNDDAAFTPGQDVGKIPGISKRNKQETKAADGEPGVIYIGHIPHGFYEFEMRQYFAQFGAIDKLRLSRNKKTGASKHFAFVQFAEESTATVVAKTMNNYLLFGHILKCKVIPKEQVHEKLFKGANRRFKKVPWNLMAGKGLQKPRTEAAWEKKVAREQSNRTKKAAKLQAMGYDFQAPQLKEVPAPAAIENVQEEIKTVEAPRAEDGIEKPAEVVVVEETVVVEKPAAGEAEVVVKSTSATKRKVSGSKRSKTGKA